MKNISRINLWLWLILLTGCATQRMVEPVVDEPPVAPASAPAPLEKPQDTLIAPNLPKPKPAASLATDSLANIGRSQYQATQYHAAIATAERGLRIDRRAAPLYLLLAQSYLQLQMPQKAMSFVQQGLRYAIPGSDTEAALQRLNTILQES